MEPRPPRPRSTRQFETPGIPQTPGIGDRLYPSASEPGVYSGTSDYAPGMAAEPPLLPRQKRRQRRALRGFGITLALVALLVALGWFFQDTLRGLISPGAPTPTVVAQIAEGDGDPAAAGTPSGEADAGALPNALATVTPTTVAASPTPRPRPTEEATLAEETSEPDRDISAQTQPLLAFLPAQDQVPAGLILADEAERSKADVVASLGGSDEASQLLDDWGWSGNAFREFIAGEEAVPPGGTTYLNVSVHRFANAESAANALIFFSDQVIFGQGLQEVEPPAVGETARLLLGAPDGVPLAVLYAQEGPILYRIGGSTATAESDPSADVLAVAAAIIPGQVSGGG